EVAVPNGPEGEMTAINLECFEDNSGSIDLTVTGGNWPYYYEWNDANYDGQQDPTGIYAGVWEVLVTDDTDCTATAMIEVMERELLEVTEDLTAVSRSGGEDGILTATPTGGTGAIAYTWDVPGGNPNAAPAGIYTVTATDNNGCTATSTIEVTEPELLEVSVTPTDALCNGTSTGSLTSTVTGGTGNYYYTWSAIPSTDPNPIDIAAGSYTVTVTDDNGCTATAVATIDQPEAQ